MNKVVNQKEKITYKDHKEEYKLITSENNRLSKYSKFFMHNNKIYQLYGSNYGNFYVGLYSYVKEIEDENKKIKLIKKFEEKENKVRKECGELVQNIYEKAYDMDSLLSAEIYEYKIKKRCIINFNIVEFKGVRELYYKYKQELEKAEKNNWEEIRFIYIKGQELIGFSNGDKKRPLTSTNIHIIKYDEFLNYINREKIILPDPAYSSSPKEKYENKIEDIEEIKSKCNHYFIESENMREEKHEIENKNKELKDTIHNLLEKNNTLSKERDELLGQNVILRNKFNRFDIMDI